MNLNSAYLRNKTSGEALYYAEIIIKVAPDDVLGLYL